MKLRIVSAPLLLVALMASFDAGVAFAGDNDAKAPVIPQLSPSPNFSDSTLPPNGDVNPYGVAFVPHGFPGGGPLRPGDIIVSNFNNSGNLQGTGTTIASYGSTMEACRQFSSREGRAQA
jgi:hypothetical protein